MVIRRIPTTVVAALRAPASRFMARSLSKVVLILLLTSGAIFAAIELLPGDWCWSRSALLIEPYEECAKRLGLDRPAAERYFRWLGGVAQGDLGTSLIYRSPIREAADAWIWHSTKLLAFAFLLAVPVGVAAGAWTGKRPRPLLRHLAKAVTAIASLPEFVTGALLILLFAVAWELLPSVSTYDRGESLLTHPEVLVLPGLTIGLWLFAYTFRTVRGRVVEGDKVLPATIKALPGMVWWTLGSLVVVETLFAYPGMGSLLVLAIVNDDRWLLRGIMMLMVSSYVLVYLAADLLAAALQRQVPGPAQPSSRLTPLHAL